VISMQILERGVRRLVGRFTTRGFTNVHPAWLCVGENCVFHWPSWHVMLGWPKVIRNGPFDLVFGLVERICPHGVGHPDPDSAAYFEKPGGHTDASIHGCDGCCSMSVQDSIIYTCRRWANA
jgi:hypothetical protein